jgi:ribosomal protein L44E
MTWKKYLYLGLAAIAITLTLYIMHLRDAHAASAESNKKLLEADARLTALNLSVSQRDDAIAGLDSALAVKAKELREKTEQLEKQARVVSTLRNKKTRAKRKEVPADCKTCFANNTKPLTIRIGHMVIYEDFNCLDDEPGTLNLDELVSKTCKSYQEVARDIVIDALVEPAPKFAEFTNRSQPYLRAATDGVSVGYRHGLVRVGRLHVEPNAEIQFDHRDGTVRWSAGITVPIDVGKKR